MDFMSRMVYDKVAFSLLACLMYIYDLSIALSTWTDTGESGRVCKSSDCDFVKCEVCVLCGRDLYRIRTVS